MSDTILSISIIVGSLFVGVGYVWLEKWLDRRKEARWEAEILEIVNRRNSGE